MTLVEFNCIMNQGAQVLSFLFFLTLAGIAIFALGRFARLALKWVVGSIEHLRSGTFMTKTKKSLRSESGVLWDLAEMTFFVVAILVGVVGVIFALGYIAYLMGYGGCIQ